MQVEELNFINMPDTDLALAHERKTYPPRISYNIDGTSEERVTFINPRRACAARVTVVGFVCVSVCVSVC